MTKKRNRIYTRIPLEERFWRQVEKTDTCWLWKGAVKTENRQIGHGVINSGGKGKALRVHRVSWELHYGPIPQGMMVCHKCDVANCVNPAHLFIGTAKDNAQDCSKKGRNYYPGGKFTGEKHGMSKLTQVEVDSIRAEYNSSRVTLKYLGDKYGVCLQNIHMIVKNKIWI